MTRRHLSITLTLGMGLALTLFLIGSQAAPANPVVHPMANSHTAAPSTNVSIAYDEAINPASVSTETFAVYAMETGLLTATYDVDGGSVSLTPAKALKPGGVVQASATKGLLSLVDGQGPISPTVWSFRVATGVAQGVFVDSGQLLGESDSFSVALGDLDSDGDLDAFVGGYNPYIDRGRPNEVWLNNGGLQGGTPGTYRDSGQRLGESRSQSVALGDLDGDGDLDAFVANGGNGTGEANQVWLNDGTGVFNTAQSLSDFNSKEVALGDLDGDGDLDAFVASSDPASRVWFNDGDAGFVEGEQLLWNVALSVALGDVDGDGDLDAVMGSYRDHANTVWLNDGLGGFVDGGESLGNAMVYDVALGDVDDDGDLDAIAATEAQAARVWLNDGTGAFSDSSQHLGTSASREVNLGDIDGDGHLDALIQHAGTEKVWLNDGTGTFSASGQGSDSGNTLSLISMEALAMGDVDGDGDLDIYGVRNAPDRVWLNQNAFRVTGVAPQNAANDVSPLETISVTLDLAVDMGSVSTRTFTVRGSQSGVHSGVYSAGSLRFESDRDFKPGEEVWVSLSDGIRSTGGRALVPYAWAFRAAAAEATGSLVDSGQLPGSSVSYAVALGDLDGDGDLDAFVGNYNLYTDVGLPDKVWLNDGGRQGGTPGTFSDSGQSLGATRSRSVALGDLDGDGDLDAFVANGGHGTGEPNSVWLNDGLGTFGLAHSLSDYLSQDVALADLDGDGDLDAWVANGSPANRVWLNDGSAAFVDSGQMPGSISQAVALGDVDGDGDVDAVVGTFGDHANAIWLNDGLGVFVESDHNLGHTSTYDLALGDVDEDGDLDAIIATETHSARVWKNDGAGAFAESGQSLASSPTTAVAMGDIDGDGDLDAFFQHGGAEKVWLNDGTGTFGAGERGLGCLDLWAAALGDLDGDRDLDAFGATGGPNRVCLNREVYRLYLPLTLKRPGQ